ncbi:hypothetical protein [uncultured Methanoregula sp.]|uniref:hypothetical protein n=1 Tax=uncultured Methanoregula sp. TaxID=1005933 RepID=UPI002AAAAAA2|nr:hypothetical protein [uncultured Methanoregula sp.]
MLQASRAGAYGRETYGDHRFLISNKYTVEETPVAIDSDKRELFPIRAFLRNCRKPARFSATGRGADWRTASSTGPGPGSAGNTGAGGCSSSITRAGGPGGSGISGLSLLKTPF